MTLYLNHLNIQDFQDILHMNDINVTDQVAFTILSILKNNSYAITHEHYSYVLESYLSKQVSLKPQTFKRLIHYFQPILTY